MADPTQLFDVDATVTWGLLISLYPYLTGLSAAAFGISAISYVFKVEAYKPIGRISLILAVVLLVIAPLTLIGELGQAGRAYTIMLPDRWHWMSPMGWGIILLTGYPIICIVEAYFFFREDHVKLAQVSAGFKRAFYRFLALWRTDLSPKALATDRRWGTIFAVLGIPAALSVHAYVGFIFSVVRARPFWNESIIPLYFLVSAMVSGTALLIIVLLLVTAWMSKQEAKPYRDLIRADLGNLFWWFLATDVAFVVAGVIPMFYSTRDIRQQLTVLLSGTHGFLVIWVENVIGLALPFLLLWPKRFRRSLAAQAFASVLVVIGVFFMRYNFVLGGQLLDRTGSQVIEYVPSATELSASVGIIGLGVALFLLGLYVLPWKTVKPEAVTPPPAPAVAEAASPGVGK